MDALDQFRLNIDQAILKGICDNIPLCILRIDSRGYIVEISGNNPHCLGGLVASKEVEQSWKSFDPINLFDIIPEFRSKIEPVFQSGKTVTFRNEKIIHGKKCVWNNYAFRIQSDTDDSFQIVLITLDITIDAIAKEKLNKKNSELKAVFDAIPDVYFRLNGDGLVLDYKSASMSQLYVPDDIFVGKSISNFLPTSLSFKVRQAIETVNTTKKLHTMEYNIPMGTSKRYFEARFFPLYEGEIIVIIREITDKVIYQDKIIEKERLLLETQKIAKVFSFFWDLEANYISMTEEFYNILGITPEEIDNTPDALLEYVHPEDKELLTLEIQNSLIHHTTLSTEYRFLLPSKQIKHMLTEAKLKYDKNGKPVKLIGLTQDISLRKEYENELLTQKIELERLLNNIEGIVSHQTTEVVLAKEKAENASQAKTLFLANMSHELKTPIHAIMSFAELGKEKAMKMDRERIEEYFSIIHDSGKKLYDLMGNILDLSKIDSGQEHYNMQTTKLENIVKEVVREMDGLFNKKNVKLNLEKPDFNTELNLDPSKISQVIRNLLINAIKFSPENSSIDISFLSGEFNFPDKQSTEKAIGFKVRDHGEGILVKEKEAIFEKFQQGSKIKPGMGGTGLGLSISKEIITAHRGILYADNHPSGGAEFVFLIPLVQS
ncbi:MAG: PAS domain-containing protein [Leptospira sp.]|nr:PAS domain-containing protein [Leptospira sp.]